VDSQLLTGKQLLHSGLGFFFFLFCFRTVFGLYLIFVVLACFGLFYVIESMRASERKRERVCRCE
jgi:hypothetical protein